MKNIIPTNINVYNKKLHNLSKNKNKSSSETNRSTLSGLIKNQDIFYACDIDIHEAENILENKQTSFKNVKRLIFETQRKLDEAMQMINKLQNGQQG